MNLLDALQRMFHIDVLPPPQLPPENKLPDDSEVRWAKAQRDALLRRARELQVDVDFGSAHLR